jgi:hypothetical protein
MHPGGTGTKRLLGRALMFTGAWTSVVFGFMLINAPGGSVTETIGVALSALAFLAGLLMAGLRAPPPRLMDDEACVAEFSGWLWRAVLTHRRVVFTQTFGRQLSFDYGDIVNVTGGVGNPAFFEDFRYGVLIETRSHRRRWIWIPDRYVEVADAISERVPTLGSARDTTTHIA